MQNDMIDKLKLSIKTYQTKSELELIDLAYLNEFLNGDSECSELIITAVTFDIPKSFVIDEKIVVQFADVDITASDRKLHQSFVEIIIDGEAIYFGDCID